MEVNKRNTLYDELVNVTRRYFGPAANRFVARQIRHHLRKNPELLQKKDLKELIEWISVAMAMQFEDEVMVNKYVADLKNLAEPN